jgi:hypothetical protein
MLCFAPAMEGRLLEGKYRIVRLIGEGGMGSVYEAEHTLIGRPVAVKVLHGDFADSTDALERFRREARAATAIRHPNIIEITDMGMTSTGQPFLVMELLEGVSLATLLAAASPIPTVRAVDLISQVLDALEAAHDKGIVHRDLKPDNVFIVQDRSRPDFVKLLDFGISKVTAPGVAGGLSMTRTGSVMGTPNYMAPEQAMGKKDVDHRADLWAVGVMLYEAFTGRLPYLGDNYNELLTNILMTVPPEPRAVNPAIDVRIEKVILRALAKDRDKRYHSAKKFRDELRAAGGVTGLTPQLAALAPQAVVPPAAPDAPPSTPPPAPVVIASAALVPLATDTLGSTTPHVQPAHAAPRPAPAAPAPRPVPPPPPRAVRPVQVMTLTPGAHATPRLEPLPFLGKRKWLIVGAGGAGAVIVIVALVLLISSGGKKESPVPAADATPAQVGPAVEPAGVADAGTAGAADTTPAVEERETTTAAARDAGGATDEAALRDAAPTDTAEAARPEAARADAGAPDARPDAGPGIEAAAPDVAARVDTAAPDAGRDAGSAPRDAARPVDRGRPGRDAGGRLRDVAAPDDARPAMRRDYI